MPAVAVAAVIAGAAIQTYGQVKANKDQASAERSNAAYYREQAAFAQTAGQREETVFIHKSRDTMAAQQGGFAAGGVDASGSALFLAEDQYYRQQEELVAMRQMTAQKVLMANMKAGFAEDRANEYDSFEYNFMTAAPTLLGAGGKVAGMSGGGGSSA